MSLEKTEGKLLLYGGQTRQVGSGGGVELLGCMNKLMRMNYEYKRIKMHTSDMNNFVTCSHKCISYDGTLQSHNLLTSEKKSFTSSDWDRQHGSCLFLSNIYQVIWV